MIILMKKNLINRSANPYVSGDWLEMLSGGTLLTRNKTILQWVFLLITRISTKNIFLLYSIGFYSLFKKVKLISEQTPSVQCCLVADLIS